MINADVEGSEAFASRVFAVGVEGILEGLPMLNGAGDGRGN